MGNAATITAALPQAAAQEAVAKEEAAAAEKLAHDLLKRAKDPETGNLDETWDGILDDLRKNRAAAKKPEVRTWSLLHWAACRGKLAAVKSLLKDYQADSVELTTDGKGFTAIALAESKQHEEVANILRASAGARQLAHRLLTDARTSGNSEEVWASIFEQLRAQPEAVRRPEQRVYSLLHQAAFWGTRDAVERLLTEFGADPWELTNNAEQLDIAGVAEAAKHAELVEWIRDWAAQRAAEVPAPYSPEAVKQALSDANPAVEWEDAVSIWFSWGPPDSDGCLEWKRRSPAHNAALQAAEAEGGVAPVLLDGGEVVDLGTGLASVPVPGTARRRRFVRRFRVCWQWDVGPGAGAAAEWRAYSPETQRKIEDALLAGDSMVAVVAGDKTYHIDLVDLRQYGPDDSFRCRRVRREGTQLRVPFPEKVRDPASGAILDLATTPAYWKAYDLQKGVTHFDLPLDSPLIASIEGWMNASARSGHTHKYGQVPGIKKPTLGFKVERVELVQSPLLWRRYVGYRGRLKQEQEAIRQHAGTDYLKQPGQQMAIPACEWLDADVNEAYLWHGSGKSADGEVDLINAIISKGHIPIQESDKEGQGMEVPDGASARFAKTTSMFGSGVYLADVSTKANLYVPCPRCHGGAYFRHECQCSPDQVESAGLYRMLVCRVVLGRVYVEKDYEEVKYKGQFNPANKLGVDSVMGEISKLPPPKGLSFREYIVYNDSACYPEFIVHYSRRAQKM